MLATNLLGRTVTVSPKRGDSYNATIVVVLSGARGIELMVLIEHTGQLEVVHPDRVEILEED